MPDSGPILLFDGVCNLCNHAVDFVIRHDPAGRIRFASLQSDTGRALLRQHGGTPGTLDSVVLVENGRLYTHSDAALRTARYLRGWRWLYALRGIPRSWRDAVYGWVARNRYRWFGQRETCRLPTPAERARFLD
jgi:predicted DCC family thiol-disulfide oxidoreductase YuxK